MSDQEKKDDPRKASRDVVRVLERSCDIHSFNTEVEWLEARRKVITASEVPAVLGASRWQTPMQLAYDKLNGAKRETTLAMESGKALEPVVATAYIEATNRALMDLGRFTLLTSKRYPWLGASLDRLIVEESPGALEIKTTTHAENVEEGNSERLNYEVQNQVQMLVAGLAWGELAVLIRTSQLVFIPTEANAKFHDAMLAKTHEFYKKVVLYRQMPAPTD